MIIINIDIAITKTNTIISEIKIAYAYNLAQAWYRSQCNEHVQNRYFYLFDDLDYFDAVGIWFKVNLMIKMCKKELYYLFTDTLGLCLEVLTCPFVSKVSLIKVGHLQGTLIKV
jgi:hypothetical protein